MDRDETLPLRIACKNPEGVAEWSVTPSGLLCSSPLPDPSAVALSPDFYVLNMANSGLGITKTAGGTQ